MSPTENPAPRRKSADVVAAFGASHLADMVNGWARGDVSATQVSRSLDPGSGYANQSTAGYELLLAAVRHVILTGGKMVAGPLDPAARAALSSSSRPVL